ncbi:hypothetical protein CIB48_g7323 [Xylaria polymorpha]|nr:hypothetical protein CIB48_g7323 [Xylaria polymorpha]
MYVVDLERTPSEILPVLVTKAPGVDMKLEGEKERRLRIDTEGLAIDVNDGGAKSMRLSCSSWDEFFLFVCGTAKSNLERVTILGNFPEALTYAVEWGVGSVSKRVFQEELL